MTEQERALLSIFIENSDKSGDIEISLETKIDDLDLDSLDILNVLTVINKKLNVDLPIEKFSLCDDIKSVSNLLKTIKPSI